MSLGFVFVCTAKNEAKAAGITKAASSESELKVQVYDALLDITVPSMDMVKEVLVLKNGSARLSTMGK